MTKKRPFREGDIIFIRYNGHSAITRLVNTDGALTPDKDTAIVFANDNSEASAELPEKFTAQEEECTRLCDATGQFRYYKNLCKAYHVVKRSLSLVNGELARVTGDNASLKGANKELKSQVQRLRDANTELACQLEKLRRNEKKTFWRRIFGK